MGLFIKEPQKIIIIEPLYTHFFLYRMVAFTFGVWLLIYQSYTIFRELAGVYIKKFVFDLLPNCFSVGVLSACCD